MFIYEIGKNRPYFSLADLHETKEAENHGPDGLDGLAYGFNPQIETEMPQYTESVEPIKAAGHSDLSVFETEMDYMKCMSGELCKKILPYIDHVLDEYDYEGSPLFGESFDIRILCEIVDKSMQCAALAIDDVKDIMLEAKGGAWDRRDLLHGVFEEAVLKEIFAVRRCNYRQIMGE